jgi:hypothetical protein
MNRDELIQKPIDLRPHVVVLGAGASRAAFPDGDALGKRLPIMSDLVEILKLIPLLKENKLDPTDNFETLYSGLVLNGQHVALQEEIEIKISNYFKSLSFSPDANHYDRLLLSLRDKDAILTFNWDPFLFDAYIRNRDICSLPTIYFLHGNVRIGSCKNTACEKDNLWGEIEGACPSCGINFSEVPLLYPIKNKNYSKHSSAYIRSAWECAESLFSTAFTFTIFGYGAPQTDKDATELFKKAWFKDNSRDMEHIEIIDIANKDILRDRWTAFTPTHHYSIEPSFSQSRIWNWPRRTCESLFYPMTKGIPCEAFPLPNTNNLDELQKYINEITLFEVN